VTDAQGAPVRPVRLHDHLAGDDHAMSQMPWDIGDPMPDQEPQNIIWVKARLKEFLNDDLMNEIDNIAVAKNFQSGDMMIALRRRSDKQSITWSQPWPGSIAQALGLVKLGDGEVAKIVLFLS
jgi:hypothetical protein